MVNYKLTALKPYIYLSLITDVDFLHADSIPLAIEDLKRVYLGENPLIEYKILRKDGSVG
jgi:hypothetical protein